ncbi:MBL fold metallo-hydrolase [Ktedonobacteria bacterium brp13]|nr:MBL fold metallo-hydrolase [Ktedonobacteria bacterium brp13]
MEKWTYTEGLHEVGNGTFAYLQPYRKVSGADKLSAWGWSNAGLVVDGQGNDAQTLLVDTLYDIPLTQKMHNTMIQAVPAAAHIDIVANTHSNGDHTNGNMLFKESKIIASLATVEEMKAEPDPSVMAMIAEKAPADGLTGMTLKPFNFRGIQKTYATETFDSVKTFSLGSKTITLMKVGPAHTKGDTLVFVPEDKVCYTGDIIFNQAHPIIWAGPVQSWIQACDTILAQDVNIIVPGHGPIAGREVVSEIKDYLGYIYDEAKQRHDAGMTPLEAANDISLERYASWLDDERIIPNVFAVYRELDGTPVENVHKLFDYMDAWTRARRK